MIISLLKAFCRLDTCSSATFFSFSIRLRRNERSSSFFAFLFKAFFLSAVGRRNLGSVSFMVVKEFETQKDMLLLIYLLVK